MKYIKLSLLSAFFTFSCLINLTVLYGTIGLSFFISFFFILTGPIFICALSMMIDFYSMFIED